jgi:hypothetical protein
VGHKSPRDITSKLIDDFVQAQSQQGLKAATQSALVGYLELIRISH